MVELGFGGNVGLGFNGGDVRSVIKNATKDPNMSESKDKTIMNKEEINKKKVAKNTKTKVQPIGGTQIGGLSGVGGININQTPKNTQTQTSKIQNNNIGGNFGMNFGGLPGGVGEISGIKVGSVNGEPTTAQTPTTGTVSNDEKMINSRGRLTALKDVVDVDSVLEDLYLDVGAGLKNGTLANVDVNNVKQLYSELAGLDDQVVLDLIADLGSLYQKGLPFNEQNLNKLKEGYPELKGVGRGFTTPAEQNMYQGGGFKEAMNEGSATDLNKYGVGGKIAETAINPLGQATTVLDAAAQQIPQVTGKKYEDKLKKELSNLTDEQIDRYYEQYKNLVSQGKLKGYTTRVKGNTLVGQMWSAIFGNEKNGRKYQDVEGGFRQWLIDQVNADVNGFAGYLMDAQYFDQDVGPNLAKMYANIPGSAVKTVTAITRAMTNPLDTLSGLTTLLFTEQGHEALKARYGSWEAIAKTMEQDPVGLASDMLAVAEGGAGLAKGGVKLGKLGTKGASLATYVLGAEKTSEGLLKIANRLERLEGKIGGFKTMAGEASDMGMRRLIYGEELPNGARKGGLINALEQRASEGDSLTNKAAGYLAKTQQPLKTAGEVVRKTKEAGGVTGRIAQKITGSATAEDKLFQAASPNINRLTRGVDYKNKRANMDLANKAIIEAGYTPKNTAERVVAHLETLNKRWKEFTDKVKGKADVDVSSERLAKVLEDHINAASKNITENQRSDINALQKEIKSLKGREKFNMIDLEDYKENINADTINKTQTAKSDIYIRGMKKLSEEIGKIQNEILSNAPDEVKSLKRTIGALLDTKDDVIKANVKNLKKKEGGGLVESYSRIQGIVDIVGGGLSVLSKGGEGIKDVAKGVGKVVLGKALGKAKDVDWLTKQGFEGLRKKYEGKGLEGGKIEGKSVETKGAKTKKGEKGLKFQKGEEGDYDKALSAAYRKGERKNRVLSESEQKKVKGEIEKKAKNAGFVTKLFDNMVDAVKKSGGEAKEGDIIHGFTNIKDKVIALSKNPLDTTAQHELFHAVFDVVDKKSKGVVLGEAKKFLEEKLGKVVSDSVAEEWLAESFGIYMRDKMIDLGIIDKAKGIAGLKQKVEKLFQRGYEWMQNYNADRFLINDFFNAMREGKGLNKRGEMDLSYLWSNKGLDVKGGAKGNKGVRFQAESFPGEKAINDYLKKPKNRIASNKQFAKRGMWTPDNYRFGSSEVTPSHVGKITTKSDVVNNKILQRIADRGVTKGFSNLIGDVATIRNALSVERVDGLKKLLQQQGADWMKNLLDGHKKEGDRYELYGKRGEWPERMDSTLLTIINNSNGELREYANKMYDDLRPLKEKDFDSMRSIDQIMRYISDGYGSNTSQAVTEGMAKYVLDRIKDKEDGTLRESIDPNKLNDIDLDQFNKDFVNKEIDVRGLRDAWADLGWDKDPKILKELLKRPKDKSIEVLKGLDERWPGRQYGDMLKKLESEDKGLKYQKATNLTEREQKQADGFVDRIVSDIRSQQREGYKFTKDDVKDHAYYSMFDDGYSVPDNVYKFVVNEALKKLGFSEDEKTTPVVKKETNKGLTPKKEVVNTPTPKKEVSTEIPRSHKEIHQNIVDAMNKASWTMFKGVDKEKLKNFKKSVGTQDLATIKKNLTDIFGSERKAENRLKKGNNGILPDERGLKYQKGWHGSTAEFDRFDSSHMGEGQGAQTHGWGHYVAVDEKVGRNYAHLIDRHTARDKYNSINSIAYKGQTLHEVFNTSNSIKGASSERSVAAKILEDVNDNKISIDAALKQNINNVEKRLASINENIARYKDNPEALKMWSREKQFAEAELNQFKKLKVSDFSELGDINAGKRNLYELDIPDPVKRDTPTGSNYLEEGKYYTKKQAMEIGKKLKEYVEKDLKKKGYYDVVNDIAIKRMEKGIKDLGELDSLSGREIYETLDHALMGQKNASKFLESLGYDGIHYFGEEDGEVYVVFKDQDMNIKNHIRFQKDIKPNAKTPDELVKINDKGLSEIVSFVSEKQAEKATNVNKALLSENGNPYMWIHTNKYLDKQFANFKNVMDSHYKGFKDVEIGWFTNNKEMSVSYNDGSTELADVKSFKSVDEFNNYLEKSAKTEENTKYNGIPTKIASKYNIKEVNKNGKNYYGLYKTNTRSEIYPNYETLYKECYHEDWGVPSNKTEAINKIEQWWTKLFGESKVKELSDGRYEISSINENQIGRLRAEIKDALPERYAETTDSKRYRYEGIIQDMKNPYVVDLGKYEKGTLKNGENVSGKNRSRNDLGTIADFIKKGDSKLGEIIKTYEQRGKEGLNVKLNGELNDVLDKLGLSKGERGLIENYVKITHINGIEDLLDQLQQNMQTNDYVFYALSEGGYDGVVIKGIRDYGGKFFFSENTRGEGGDVAVTFHANQFKDWHNTNPTDSKYIAYQKDTSNKGLTPKKKKKGLQLGRSALVHRGVRYKDKEEK